MNIDALWRVLRRVLVVLTIAIPGLLVGLNSRPQRTDSVLGLIVVAIVALPVLLTVWRLPAPVRARLRTLPRHRPLLTTAAGCGAAAVVLVLCWSVCNACAPGTLAPLPLAFLAVLLAWVAVLVRRRA